MIRFLTSFYLFSESIFIVSVQMKGKENNNK